MSFSLPFACLDHLPFIRYVSIALCDVNCSSSIWSWLYSVSTDGWFGCSMAAMMRKRDGCRPQYSKHSKWKRPFMAIASTTQLFVESMFLIPVYPVFWILTIPNLQGGCSWAHRDGGRIWPWFIACRWQLHKTRRKFETTESRHRQQRIDFWKFQANRSVP